MSNSSRCSEQLQTRVDYQDMSETQSTTQEVPRFLELPRELRDIIYEYVLYRQEGLYYQRVEYDRPLLIDPRTVSFSKESGAKPTTLHRSGQLITKDSAIWLNHPCSLWPGTWGGKEVNQLKYTCRQIRQETIGLELALGNDLIFHGGYGMSAKPPSEYTSPAVQFLDFFGLHNKFWWRGLHHVYLRDPTSSMSFRSKDISSIRRISDNFCLNNPQIVVFWQTPLLDPRTLCYFLANGLVCDLVLRGTSVSPLLQELRLCNSPIYQQMSEDLWRPADLGSAQSYPIVRAPNFRLMPYHRPLDEVDWEKNDQHFFRGDDLLPQEKERIRALRLELVRSWYKHGVIVPELPAPGSKKLVFPQLLAK